MSPRLSAPRIMDFTGGEASVFPYTRMPAKYSLLLSNAYITEQGGIGKIPGYAAVNTSSCGVSLKNGFEFKKVDGAAQLLAAGGGKVFKVNGAALDEIATGLDTDAVVNFSSMGNVCIATNGVEQKKWDGTTWGALGGSIPATTFKTHVHKGRVWAAERNNKMLATHSSLNNPEEYTGGTSGYIDFQYVLRGGDELLDFSTYIDLLVFYFRNHTLIYSGTTPSGTGVDFQLVQNIPAGLVATNGVLPLGTDSTFVSHSGIKRLKEIVNTGNLNMDDLSQLITPTIQTKVKDNLSAQISVAHYPRRGWALFKIGTTVYIYSYVWKAWQRLVGADVNAMFTTSDDKLYLCGTNFLYLFDDVYARAGVPYEWRWETAWMSLSKTMEYGFPKEIQIVPNTSAACTVHLQLRHDLKAAMAENMMDFSLQTDATEVDDITDIDAWGPIDETELENILLPIFGAGRISQLVFTNNSTVGPIEILDIIPQYIMGG